MYFVQLVENILPNLGNSYKSRVDFVYNYQKQNVLMHRKYSEPILSYYISGTKKSKYLFEKSSICTKGRSLFLWITQKPESFQVILGFLCRIVAFRVKKKSLRRSGKLCFYALFCQFLEFGRNVIIDEI